MSETKHAFLLTLMFSGFLVVVVLLSLGIYIFFPFMPYILTGCGVLVLTTGVLWFRAYLHQKYIPVRQAKQEAEQLAHQRQIERDRLQLEREQIALQRERQTHELAREQEQHQTTVALMLKEFELRQHLALTRLTPSSDGYPALIREEGIVTIPSAGRHPQLAQGRAGDEQGNKRPGDTSLVQLPPPIDVFDLLKSGRWIPSREHLMLAVVQEGPLSIAYKLAWHIALAGATGGGKTNELRIILAQMVLWYEVYYISPAFAPIKANKEDWRPIQARLAGPVARKGDEIEFRLQWALYQLQDRQDREYAGDHSWKGKPIFVVIDEYKEVIARYPGAANDVCNLLRQARQYEIFAVVAAQDFLIKNIGGDSGARDCYRTAIYFGGDPTTCKALLDVPGALDYEQNLGKEGHVVIRTKTTQTSQARAPFMSNRAVYELLGWPDDPILDDSPITSSASYSMPDPVPTNGTTRRNTYGYRAEERFTGALARNTVGPLVEPVEQGSDDGSEGVPDGTTRSDEKQFTPAQELEFIKRYRVNQSIRKSIAEMRLSYGRYQKYASQLVESRKLKNT